MQRDSQPANRAAILKEIHRMRDEHASLRFVPTRIERDVEPARQPVKHFLRRAAHIEQNLRGRDAVLDRSVYSFEIREKSIEKRRRLIVFPVHGRQVVGEIREARVVRAQSGQARRAAFVTAQPQLQLQIAAACTLEQQLPRAGADIRASVSLSRSEKWNLRSTGAQVWSRLELPLRKRETISI